jgi:hypothetical protein
MIVDIDNLIKIFEKNFYCKNCNSFSYKINELKLIGKN